MKNNDIIKSYKGIADNVATIILIIYSILTKFLVSINSIRFGEVFTETDQSIFFSIGKAILHGKVLYKDVFDHKTPYIYFFNAFAALFEKNHLGLFIIEVVLLSTILIFTYKTAKLFVTETKAFLSDIVLAVILSIPQITFGYSRTEMYAIAFIMPSIYLFAKYFVDTKIVEDDILSSNVAVSTDGSFKLSHMFIIGILASLTFMTNIRAVVIFVPFAIALLIKLLSTKNFKNLLLVILSGLCGFVITIIPYIIYAVATNSLGDAIYAIFTSNVNYANSNFAFGKNFIKTAATFISNNSVFFAFTLISFVSWFFVKMEKFTKFSIIISMIVTMSYIVFSNRTNPYYLVILMPYLMSIYFIIVRFINIKVKVSDLFIFVTFAILFLFINVCVNRDIKIRYLNCVHRAERINNAISSNLNKSDAKVLSFGFNPETYIYTGSVVDYKYFIIPNIPYKADKLPYNAQYEYIMSRDPDVVVYANSNAASDMPKEMFDRIRYVLSTAYDLVDEFKTNEFTGTFYIFVKKGGNGQ